LIISGDLKLFILEIPSNAKMIKEDSRDQKITSKKSH
jgi:hypothetical protein